MAHCKVKDALRLWYTADTVGRKGVDNKVIPPLRVVQRADFADKVNQRRFSQDIKPLVGTLEKLLSYDEAAASVLMPTEWSKQKHHALTQPQFDKLWEKTIQFLPVATKKGFRKSKPADLSMGYARKILRNELEAKKAAASSGKKPRAKKKRAKKNRENTQAGVSNAALRKKHSVRIKLLDSNSSTMLKY